MKSARGDVRFLVRFGRLQPHSSVLDVGCGTGRLAVGLAEYLSHEGRYEGFDVRREAVAWAAEHVAVGDPRFRFAHVDVRAGSYNPDGSVEASIFRFPYPDASFHLVVLLSVFTHLVPRDMQNYLSECARVLASGGRIVATYLILEEPGVVEIPNNTLDFAYDLGGFFSIDAAIPERTVAYREAFIQEAWRDAGLAVEAMLPGKWRSSTGPNWQDTVVGHRLRPPPLTLGERTRHVVKQVLPFGLVRWVQARRNLKRQR